MTNAFIFFNILGYAITAFSSFLLGALVVNMNNKKLSDEKIVPQHETALIEDLKKSISENPYNWFLETGSSMKGIYNHELGITINRYEYNSKSSTIELSTQGQKYLWDFVNKVKVAKAREILKGDQDG